MVDDITFWGVTAAVAAAGGYALLYLYCSALHGTGFCHFPCEPLVGGCKEKTLRVRAGDKL